eukprot:GEMP01043663.1.p1 GENE.GEMP01043663.1~~GEMP01043663.1.p1  ORF type:complete len:325 (-),score=114.35 GEMP01043663.1:715-1689(-)
MGAEKKFLKACSKGDTFAVWKLIAEKKKGCRDARTKEGDTVLHLAARLKNQKRAKEMMELLLSLDKMDRLVNVCNDDGDSALGIACRRHYGEVATQLAQAGADVGAVPEELEAAELIDETMRERRAEEKKDERVTESRKRLREEYEFNQRLQEEATDSRDVFLRNYTERSYVSAQTTRDRAIRQERHTQERIELEKMITEEERRRQAEHERFEQMQREEAKREEYHKRRRPCDFPRPAENRQEEDERRWKLFDSQVGVITFGDIPWPQVDKWETKLSAKDKKRLLLRWHPDKFLPKVDGRVLQTDIQTVRQTCNEVCGKITSLV